MNKTAYLSPATGTLDISVIRDSRPYVSITLDLGIPNFTVFSLKLPLVEDAPTSMSGIIAEAVHCLLDEMSAFMISVGFREEVIVHIYATILTAFKGMTGESDTNKSMDAIGKDPVVKTFEGSFKLPMDFINETYDRVVTAAGKTIKRPPVTRHLELTYEKPSKTTVNDARKVIRDFKNRRLKSQPGPMYIIVYDTFGNPRATIPVGNNFKNQLLNQVYKKKASEAPQYTPTVKFDNDIEMKTTNVEGIPKSVFVGDEKYGLFAYINDDMALYASEKEWVVKFPDGRCVAFSDFPTVGELKQDNYPVPTIYTNWTVLSKEAVPESSDESEAVNSQGNEVIDETESESNPVSDLKADDDKNEQLEEGEDDKDHPEGDEMSSKMSAMKVALNVPRLVQDFGKKLVSRYKIEHPGQNNITPEQVIDKIKLSDPTGNKEYTAWMVGQYARGNDPKFPDKGVKRFEDFQSRIAPALKRYDFLKRTGKLPVEERNIGQLHGALALETLVDKYKNEAEVSNRQQDVNKDKELTASGQAEVVLNDAKYKIIIPRTEEAAKWFGVNTKWCTAAETNNMFANYADDPLYIILIKADNLRFQFSFPHAQFMDERDSEINVYSWCKDYPELALFFEPIAEEAKDTSWCSYCTGGKVDCSYCSGQGWGDCDECGNGEVNCSECGGEGTVEVEDDEGDTGSEECSTCDGGGTQPCSDCGGTGREDCSYCAGEGEVDCDMCAGTGESADIEGFLAGARRAKSNLAQAKAMGATASKMTRIQKLMKNRPDLVAKLVSDIGHIPNSWMNATGDVVTGDVIRFKEGVFGGSFKSPKFLGEREITARIINDNYGASKQQHTFTLDVLGSSGVQPLTVGLKTTRKGRNVYRNGTERLEWQDEHPRGVAADEKHTRGDEARAVRDRRRNTAARMPSNNGNPLETVYRDALGNPEPRASIWVIGGNYSSAPGSGARYTMSTTSDAPTKTWPFDSPNAIAPIIKEMEAQGWVCTLGKDGHNHPKVSLIHRPTQSAMEEAHRPANDAIEKGRRCYVRFGKPPESGKSHNYRDNYNEEGVSVFRAYRYKGVCVIVVAHNSELGSLMTLQSRPLYEVVGRQIGIGSDGEPVLGDCQIKRIRDKVYMAEMGLSKWREPESKRANHTDEKGYWVGEGGGASGILPICTTTGRICLAWRSAEVASGDCWGTIGGAIQEGMSAIQSTKMELAEETGYCGDIHLIPAFMFQDSSFTYQNYIGLVPTEFGLHPMAGGGHGMAFKDETDFIEWFTWEDLQNEITHNADAFHPGLLKLTQQSGAEIEKICSAASN